MGGGVRGRQLQWCPGWARLARLQAGTGQHEGPPGGGLERRRRDTRGLSLVPHAKPSRKQQPRPHLATLQDTEQAWDQSPTSCLLVSLKWENARSPNPAEANPGKLPESHLGLLRQAQIQALNCRAVPGQRLSPGNLNSPVENSKTQEWSRHLQTPSGTMLHAPQHVIREEERTARRWGLS